MRTQRRSAAVSKGRFDTGHNDTVELPVFRGIVVGHTAD